MNSIEKNRIHPTVLSCLIYKFLFDSVGEELEMRSERLKYIEMGGVKWE
jgi:hypothetical protein